MRTSVVIPSAGVAYEGRTLLSGALLASQLAAEVVVVVTNGRITSAGRNAVRRYGAKTVDVDGPFNFSRAVNAGVAAASHDRIVLLNDDVALARRQTGDWISRLARKRGDIKGVLLVDPDEQRIEHAGIWFGGPGGLPCHIGWREPTTLAYPDGPTFAVTGAAMMFHRRVHRLLDGYDEGYENHFADVDFCLRAGRADLTVAVYNSIRLVHHEAKTKVPTDLLPDFRRLAERHGETLATEAIYLNPDAVANYYATLN